MQSSNGACELTVTCMSLSLLELDLGKIALEAGKQTNHKVNTATQWGGGVYRSTNYWLKSIQPSFSICDAFQLRSVFWCHYWRSTQASFMSEINRSFTRFVSLAVSPCKAVSLLWFVMWCSTSLLLFIFHTLIYTHKFSDESPSSHHHSGTQKTCSTLSHAQTHTSTQCCSVRTNKRGRVQGKMKQFGTLHTALYQHEKTKANIWDVDCV